MKKTVCGKCNRPFTEHTIKKSSTGLRWWCPVKPAGK